MSIVELDGHRLPTLPSTKDASFLAYASIGGEITVASVQDGMFSVVDSYNLADALFSSEVKSEPETHLLTAGEAEAMGLHVIGSNGYSHRKTAITAKEVARTQAAQSLGSLEDRSSEDVSLSSSPVKRKVCPRPAIDSKYTGHPAPIDVMHQMFKEGERERGRV